MNENKKKAIVVSLNEDVSEIVQLAGSLGYEIIKTFVQHKNIPDTSSYIGSGKVEEIKKFIEDCEKDSIALVIIDGELKPSQWFILEKELKVEVYDRVRLILAIFAERADRKEAKLQVKLAQLQYERPFVRELIHRARAGEHPGFLAGGEYQVDDYYEMIKKQTKRIKENLEMIRGERDLRRRHRHTGGFYLVSLAGYTNAGKSSLLNVLSGEEVKVEGRLFSTLSTTTRKITDKNFSILLTDTVGFIQNLPAWIIDAFHSTLEEIEVADVVLLIADVSEDKEIVEKKLKVSLDELVGIGVTSPIVVVLNKIDLLSEDELEIRINYLKKSGLTKNREVISVSAKNRKNMGVLLGIIHDLLPHLAKIKIRLPANEKTQSFVSWIYGKAHISDIVYEDCVTISVECSTIMKDKILSRCLELGGFVV
jgi:GTP-binding protein HflX